MTVHPSMLAKADRPTRRTIRLSLYQVALVNTVITLVTLTLTPVVTLYMASVGGPHSRGQPTLPLPFVSEASLHALHHPLYCVAVAAGALSWSVFAVLAGLADGSMRRVILGVLAPALLAATACTLMHTFVHNVLAMTLFAITILWMTDVAMSPPREHAKYAIRVSMLCAFFSASIALVTLVTGFRSVAAIFETAIVACNALFVAVYGWSLRDVHVTCSLGPFTRSK